jgi:hypothetical protein
MKRETEHDHIWADRFQERIDDLLHHLLTQRSLRNHRDIERHLIQGLARRLHMIKDTLLHFEKLPKEGGPSIPASEIIRVNVSINATYLNLRGALDNLAWALGYELPIKEGLSESDVNDRRLVTLFGNNFLKCVANHSSDLAEELRELTTWGRDLKRFRDPAAHRVPMYLSPGMVFPEEAEEIRASEAEGLKVAKETGDGTLLRQAILKRSTAGRFHPVVIVSEQDHDLEAHLFWLLNTDHDQFLRTVEIVLRHRFLFTQPQG